MIIDKLLIMSWDQAVTASGDTASTDVIDLGVAEDMGIGDDPSLKVVLLVTAAFTRAAGALTLTTAIQGSADNGTWTSMAITPAIAKADLTAGVYIANWDLPSLIAGQALPRYLRVLYTLSAAGDAGSVRAFINLDRQQNRAYPPGIAIAN